MKKENKIKDIVDTLICITLLLLVLGIISLPFTIAVGGGYLFLSLGCLLLSFVLWIISLTLCNVYKINITKKMLRDNLYGLFEGGKLILQGMMLITMIIVWVELVLPHIPHEFSKILASCFIVISLITWKINIFIEAGIIKKRECDNLK